MKYAKFKFGDSIPVYKYTRKYRPISVSILGHTNFTNFVLAHYPEYAYMRGRDMSAIIAAFNRNLTKAVHENRFGAEFPQGLGLLFLGVCEPRKRRLTYDNKKISEGTLGVHQNWNTDNKLLKVFFTNYQDRYRYENKHLWTFNKGEELRKGASEAFLENPSKWIQVPNHKEIRSIVKRFFAREWSKVDTERRLADYDEFDMKEDGD